MEVWPLVGRGHELAHLERSLRSGPNGVLVRGAAGVGKTRLTSEFGQRCARKGHNVRRFMATASSATVPLGPLAHLIVESEPSGHDSLVHVALSRLVEDAAKSPRPIVVFDDINHADPSTLTVIEQVVAETPTFLVATSRTEAGTEPLSLWKDGLVEALDLDGLPDPEIALILSEDLGGTVDPHARDRIVHLSGGSPLLLRELLRGARRTGALRQVAGRWELDSSIGLASGIVDLVRATIDHLSLSAREALDAICLAEPLPVEVAAAVSSDSEIETLEELGIVGLSSADDDRLAVAPSHPIFGDVIRSTLGSLRRRRLTRAIAAAFDEHPQGGRLLQHARLHLEAGTVPPEGLFEQAASVAHRSGDSNLALDLAQDTLGRQPSTSVAIVAAEAAAAHGDPALSTDLFTLAEQHVAGEDDLAEVALSRSRLLLYEGRSSEALLLLERAGEQLIADSAAVRLEIARAEILGFTGRWSEAREIAERVLAESNRPSVVFVAQSLIAFASAFLGPHAMAATYVRDARLQLELVEAPKPHHLAWLAQTESYVATFDGRAGQVLDECARRASEYLVKAVYPEWSGHWSMAGALFAAMHSSIDQRTLQLCEDGITLLGHRDVGDMYSFAVSNAALASAMVADDERAAELLWLYDEELRDREQKTTALADRARLWVTARTAGVDEAVDLAFECANEVEQLAPLFAVPIFHDLARFGRPDLVVDPLARLAHQISSTLTTLLADDAQSRYDEDAQRLLSVADRFERSGYRQLAAESYMAVDRFLGSTNHETLIERLTAAELVVPILPSDRNSTHTLDPLAALTSRQREIARLAATGLTTPAIARELHLSPRTVSNHLGAVYAQLGLSGRDELKGLFGPSRQHQPES